MTPQITLHQGDSLAYLPTLPSASVDLLLADPPYSSGGAFRDDRAKGTSEKYQNTETEKEYPEFLGDNRDQMAYYYWSALWMGQASRILKPGRVACIFTDWRQLATTVNAFQVGGFVWRGVIPWNKTEAARPTKGRFRAQCEYIVWGTAGPMEQLTEACLPGFYSILETTGGYTYPVNAREKKHVTSKPLPLIRNLLDVLGDTRGVVLDPFMGGGTTGEAAVERGHAFIGCEMSEHYFEIASKAIHEAARSPMMFTATAQPAQLFQG
jgi:site-specific DNA-methyltransferase (adenine-specific)